MESLSIQLQQAEVKLDQINGQVDNLQCEFAAIGSQFEALQKQEEVRIGSMTEHQQLEYEKAREQLMIKSGVLSDSLQKAQEEQ